MKNNALLRGGYSTRWPEEIAKLSGHRAALFYQGLTTVMVNVFDVLPVLFLTWTVSWPG